MKRFYILFLICALFLVACDKENSAVQPTVFGEKTLSAKDGRFLILFKGDGVWSVSTDEDWLHVEERLYKDEAAFEVIYDSNESTIGDHNFCRCGHVNIISTEGKWHTVMNVRQEGLAPFISLSGGQLPQEAGRYRLHLQYNLTDRERDAITFTTDAPWITGISLDRDGESVVIEVTAGSSRSGNITMTFTDAWGRKHTASATVQQ